MDEKFKQLVDAVVVQGDAAEYQGAQNSVLLCAVAALVQTHPDPSAFAAQFRRAWQLIGSQHSNEQASGQSKQGFADVLSILEQACAVPLNVRPPGIAELPEQR